MVITAGKGCGELGSCRGAVREGPGKGGCRLSLQLLPAQGCQSCPSVQSCESTHRATQGSLQQLSCEVSLRRES